MPCATKQIDTTRPTQDRTEIALNDWSATIEEMLFMVPSVVLPKRASEGYSWTKTLDERLADIVNQCRERATGWAA